MKIKAFSAKHDPHMKSRKAMDMWIMPVVTDGSHIWAPMNVQNSPAEMERETGIS